MANFSSISPTPQPWGWRKKETNVTLSGNVGVATIKENNKKGWEKERVMIRNEQSRKRSVRV
jgi:hypothetical protein